MNLFADFVSTLIYITFIIFLAVGSYKFYNICPPSWFMENKSDVFSAPDPRLRKKTEKILYCGLFSFLNFILYLKYDISTILFSGIFTIIFLSFIFISDIKTGIIPDQFVFCLVFISLFWILSDIGMANFSVDRWYMFPVNRLSGGIAGAAVLIFVNITGSLILKKEAMGMGDIKLIFACGLITGLEGIFPLIIISFISSLPFAIAKAVITAKKNPLIKKSVFSGDKIPFGPFICGSTALFILIPGHILSLFAWWLSL